MDIHFRSIGKIHVKATDAEVREKGDVEGELEIEPEFAEALDGIDGYSHLFVIVYFDRLRPEQIGPLKVKPRGLLRKGFKLEDLPFARRVCPGLADSAQSDRTDTRALFGSQRHPTFCPRPRFLKRYANPRHQRLSSAVPNRSIHYSGMVSKLGRRKRLCLESFARLKSRNAVLSKLRKESD
jgi:hypothetical protein